MPAEALAPKSRNPLDFNHIAAQAAREPRLRKLVAISPNGRLDFEKQSGVKGTAHQFRGRRAGPLLRCQVVVECCEVVVEFSI